MFTRNITSDVGFSLISARLMCVLALQKIILAIISRASGALAGKIQHMLPVKDKKLQELYRLECIVPGDKEEKKLPLLHHITEYALLKALDSPGRFSQVYLLSKQDVEAIGYSLVPGTTTTLVEKLKEIEHSTQGFITMNSIDTVTYRGYVAVCCLCDPSKKLPDIVT